MNWLGSRSEILFRDSLCNHSFKKNKIEGLSFPEVYRVSISILNLIQKNVYCLLSNPNVSIWFIFLVLIHSSIDVSKAKVEDSLYKNQVQPSASEFNFKVIFYCLLYWTYCQKILPALLIFTNLLCIANKKPGGGIIPTNKTVFLIKLNIIITIKACLIKTLYHLPSSSIMDAAYTCKWHITNINWFKLGH